MRASSKRALSVGLAAIFFIATLVVYSSLISPELDVVTKQRAELSTSQDLFNSQKDATQSVKKLFKDMQNASSVRDTISLALPVGPSMTEALHQIDSMSGVSRVSVDSFVITPATPEASNAPLVKRLGKLEIAISVSGNYDSVRGFLKLLETNIRVVNVKSFEFSTNKGQNVANPYTLKVVADMFYQEN